MTVTVLLRSASLVRKIIMCSRSPRRFVHVDRRLLRRDNPSPQHKDTTLRNALAKPRAGRCCPTMIKDSLRSAEPNGRPRPVGGA